MTKANKPNNAAVIDKATQRLAALKSYVKNGKTEVPVDGVPTKVTAMIAIYQTCLDTRAALSTKRAETKVALGARAKAEVSRRAADRALKPWVINQFGANSQQALDFGFPPPKVPTRTVGEKADAVALGKATRTARNTMGPKEKLKIKGTLAVPTAPAAPAINAAPAAISPASAPLTPVTVASPPQASSAAASAPSAPALANGVPSAATNGASH